LKAGHLELMVHRSPSVDDARGVAEPLNETEFVTPYNDSSRSGGGGVHFGPRLRITGEHVVVGGFSSNPGEAFRNAERKLYLRPFVTFTKNLAAGRGSLLAEGSLPPSVHLVTLSPLDIEEKEENNFEEKEEKKSLKTQVSQKQQLLLRLAHEGDSSSASVPVDLGKLFNPVFFGKVIRARKTTVTANRELSDVGLDGLQAVLAPGELITWVLDVEEQRGGSANATPLLFQAADDENEALITM